MMDEFKFNMGPHTRMRKMALKGFQPRSFLPFFSFETRHLRCILRSSALFTRFWGGIFGFLCAHNGRPSRRLGRIFFNALHTSSVVVNYQSLLRKFIVEFCFPRNSFPKAHADTQTRTMP
jgi:hypothetical protein